MAESVKHSPSGIHLLADLYGCPQNRLSDPGWLDGKLVAAADEAGATVVNSSFHHFSPQGVSGVVIIAESHITIHTWPEIGYAALDVFTCGRPELTNCITEKIVEQLEAESVKYNQVKRGTLLNPAMVANS